MKIALVTGAHKGLGFEWCKQLVSKGYEVILTARNFSDALKSSQHLTEKGFTVYPYQLDITEPDQIDKIATWVKERFGKLDLLINNAGINSGTRAKGNAALQQANLSLDHLSKSELLAMVDINAVSPILLSHALRSVLNQSSRPKIINIGSWLGSITHKNNGGNYSYAVSKSALNMMNRAFAFDVKEEQIISVVVNPGWVQTDMGGSKAQFTPQTAVRNILTQVVEKITLEDTGNFFNYDGSIHPW